MKMRLFPFGTVAISSILVFCFSPYAQASTDNEEQHKTFKVVEVAPSLDSLADEAVPVTRQRHQTLDGSYNLRRGLQEANETTRTVSPYFQWETNLWQQRNIQANVTLDLDAFDVALQNASDNQCELGITATVFDADANQIFQKTVGSNYHNLAATGSFRNAPWVSGWTGDTVFALYSNSKIFVSSLFMAAVVETGLGYLDEPLYRVFDDYLTPANRTGRMTPRMILSHRSGIQAYNRNDPINDPLYSCIASVNTTLEDCVEEHLLNDAVLANDPGSLVRYSNDPFYIMAAVLVRKTGLKNIDEVMNKYINEPLNISASWDCPLVGSTPEKPHVSWGVCATGHDMAKLIQSLMRATDPTVSAPAEDGEIPLVVSPTSLKEMFSFQAGVAANADEPLGFNMPLSNCLSRADDTVNFLIGYGLGTMITAGIKGILFVHAATVGGYLVISPGKYAAYFAFMKTGAFPSAYEWIVRVIDVFERASSVFVGNTWDGTDVYPNEVTPCVDGMFLETTALDDALEVWENCPAVAGTVVNPPY